MIEETYRIDEAERRVWVTVGGDEMDAVQRPFDDICRLTSSDILDGKLCLGWDTFERRRCYAVARDELLDRRLIEDVSITAGPYCVEVTP